ncbi:unnamed protein product [Menidia menidia]|uniref:(Atlantic silverside) hypothetical protein n=1 Tax=Menidia menidia TaxID=238744 RepID=A0A8S4AGK7_9TELE|nr:unnamed protein product [Menidia menidia]
MNVCPQEAMCDEDMPAVFQYFTQVPSPPPPPSLRPSSSPPAQFSASVSHQEALCEEEQGGLDPKDPNRPRFTLQELRDVLHERNELKAKEAEDEMATPSPSPSPEPRTRSSAQPESGIKRLIFTAIMPMVAAGLIPDDPTLQPIRRLMSLV